jgi:hypothetical protein
MSYVTFSLEVIVGVKRVAWIFHFYSLTWLHFECANLLWFHVLFCLHLHHHIVVVDCLFSLNIKLPCSIICFMTKCGVLKTTNDERKFFLNLLIMIFFSVVFIYAFWRGKVSLHFICDLFFSFLNLSHKSEGNWSSLFIFISHEISTKHSSWNFIICMTK